MKTGEPPPAAKPGHGSGKFHLDLGDALTPDPGTEDMFKTEDSKFAFSPGQLSKLFNPKSHNAFYAMGGLAGLEKGLQTDRNSGLSLEEVHVDKAVTFEEVAAKGAPKYGASGDTLAEPKELRPTPPPSEESKTGGYLDRKRIFTDNRLPERKSKTLLQLAWQTYNDKVLILLTVAAVVSLALGLYQTLGGEHKEGEARVEWVEGVAIIVAILLVVAVGTVNDCESTSGEALVRRGALRGPPGRRLHAADCVG